MTIGKIRGLIVAVWATALVVHGPPHAAAANVAGQIADLPASTQDKISTSIRAFVKVKTFADGSANDLGWDCQAAACLVELGMDGARARLKIIADEIQNDARRSVESGKPIGWSAVEERTVACVSAPPGAGSEKVSCEGKSTVYAFQTGLGLACMARAGVLLQLPGYLQTAKDVMAYWDRLWSVLDSAKPRNWHSIFSVCCHS